MTSVYPAVYSLSSSPSTPAFHPTHAPSTNSSASSIGRPSTSASTHTGSYTSPPTTPSPGPTTSTAVDSQQSYLETVSSWSDAQVGRWLAENRCGNLANTFRENDIRGNVILDLDMIALKEMGITSVGERVKVMAAVKQLRKACSNASSTSSTPARVLSSTLDTSTSRPSTASTLTSQAPGPLLLRPPPPSQPLPRRPATSPSTSPSYATRPLPMEPSPVDAPTRRGMRNAGRPPPLDLTSSSSIGHNLPQVVDVPPSSAVSLSSAHPSIITPRAVPPLHPTAAPLSATAGPHGSSGRSVSSSAASTFSRHEKEGSGSSRANLPPPVPPPKNQALPPPPTGQTLREMPSVPVMRSVPPRDSSMQRPPLPRQTSTPSELPYTNATAAQSTPALVGSSNTSLPGLPRGPADTKRGAFNRSISPAPLPAPPSRQQAALRSHARADSLKVNTIPAAVSRPTNRPATSGSTPTTTTRHPYAVSGSSLQLPPFGRNQGDLSPITEISPMSSGPPLSSTGSTLMRDSPASAYSSSAYTSTKGSISGRPQTPSTGVSQQPSLQDLRRKLVKFMDAENGHTSTLNVEDCDSGVEVLIKVLKKFNKPAKDVSALDDKAPDGVRDGALSLDGWAIFLESAPKSNVPGDDPLTDTELLEICTNPAHPARERSLYLKQLVSSTQHAQRQAAKLAGFFGEAPPAPATQQAQTSPTSPTYVIGPKMPDAEDGGSYAHLAPYGSGTSKTTKQLNRASTISVMSGLGGVQDHVPRSPSSSSFLASPKGKIASFFSRRPPSELITNNLPEYFPNVERKALNRAARHSIMRKRDNERRSASRFSISSNESGGRYHRGTPPASLNASPLPGGRLSVMPPPRPFESSPRISISDTDEPADDPTIVTIGPPQLLPPVEVVSDSLVDALNVSTSPSGNLMIGGTPASSLTNSPSSVISISPRTASQRRMSGIFKNIEDMRAKRDKSDTASIVTVDQITQRVESRRQSSLSLVSLNDEAKAEEDEDGQYVVITPKPPHGLSPAYEDEDEQMAEQVMDDEEEEEDDEEEEEEEEEGEVEADETEEHKKQTSTGKRAFRWIKGALIGAGSFGSVYLGMDASSGSLMAVKQVELPTGTTNNEERKKNMLIALEREIELLKTLQHENIVQYIDSSSDEKYLNIFLEYVPGGSVAALLKSYGAFEEPLVGNFVRQILTGLNYLHERDIIHRDIKGANILVDNKGGVKISDFGISKKVEAGFGSRAHRPSLQGSVFWMAPEVAMQKSGAYTRKADIWSIGCLVLEMLTGQRPWAELDQMQAMWKIGTKVKPPFPIDISATAVDFLNKTLDGDPVKRPTAAELLLHPFVSASAPAN